MLAPGSQPETTDEPRAQIGQDVAVQVRQDEDVVVLRALYELHREVVDDPVLERDVRVLRGDPPGGLEEEAVGELHDVGLVPDGERSASACPDVVEGEPDDPVARPLADRLDAEARVRSDACTRRPLDEPDQLGGLGLALLELDPRVQALGGLADHHQVDPLVARSRAGVPAAGPNARVEIERDAERDVHAAERAADRRRDGALERDARLADRVENALGQRRAFAFGDLGPDLLDVPLDRDARRLDRPSSGLDQLGAHAVAGDQRDAMRAQGSPLLLRLRFGCGPARRRSRDPAVLSVLQG